MSDQIKKYLLPDRSARVQAVRLSDSWTTGLAHQDLPEAVRNLLGELVAAATLLAANLKFDGSLVLQLQGEGPIALLVVECTADLKIRATATLRDDHDIPADGTLQSLLNHNGEGRFVVVLDPNRADGTMQPYQGIVPLEGTTVAQALEHYMLSSEQLDTRLWLAADNQHCAGLLLQRLPDHGGNTADGSTDAPQNPQATWNDVRHLLQTVKTPELLDTDTDTLIHRLLWEQDLIALEAQDVRWHCPCTRQRVADMLRMLGQDEVMSIVSEQEHVNVACNFCGKPYTFDAIDCASLFVDPLNATNDNNPSLH